MDDSWVFNYRTRISKGILPEDFNKMNALQNLGLQNYKVSGPLSIFLGMTELKQAYLNEIFFTEIPSNFFNVLDSLQVIPLDLIFKDFHLNLYTREF